MICKETNINKQQHERTENERMKQLTAKGSYAPNDELTKFGRCQRRFFPPMKNITCFTSDKQGHTSSIVSGGATLGSKEKIHPVTNMKKHPRGRVVHK